MMKEYTLPIAFLLAPFAILSTGYIWTGQQIGLMIIFLVLMATMIDNKWLRAFLFYAIAWQVFLFAHAMIHPYKFQAASASGYTQVLFMTAGAMIYLMASKSKINLPVFYNVICVAALIQTVIALFQKFGGVDLVPMVLSLIAPTKSKLGEGALVGTLGNPNYLAAFLAFSVPFFFRKGWSWTVPLVIVALIAAYTSTAAIALGIGMGVFVTYLYREGKLNARVYGESLTLIALWIICYSFFFHPSLFQVYGTPAAEQVRDLGRGESLVRGDIWMYAWAAVSLTWQNFIFGLGPGAAWKYNYPLHSEWVTLLHQFGLIGLTIAAGYLLTVSRKNIYLFSAFIIIVINMFGNAALHIAPTAFLICMVAGLMERERKG
ncbi:MAG: hypothetical protein ABIJ57_14970 [Pseudomonadota bacterium]